MKSHETHVRSQHRCSLRYLLLPLFAGAVLAVLASPAFCHGPVHEQIKAATQQIRENPSDAMLYLKRGELYFFDTDWDASLADYDTAAALAPDLLIIDYYRGKTLLAASRPGDATRMLDRLIESMPELADAYILRARANTRLSEYRLASRDYETALGLVSTVSPELYIEWARAESQGGEKGVERAITVLDKGLGKLGQIVTLQLLAIEMEIRIKQFDSALQRLDQIAAQSARQEKWLFRRGEVLRQAGRTAEARAAYSKALAALSLLSESRKRSKAIIQLESQIRAALEELP